MKINTVFSKKSLKPAELVAVGYFEEDKPMPKELSARKFGGRCGEQLLVPGPKGQASPLLLAMGLGKREKFTLERVRRAAAKAVSQGGALKAAGVRIDLDSFGGKFLAEDTAAAAAEGARLAGYRFKKYKSKPGSGHEIERLDLFSNTSARSKNIQRAVREAELVADAVYFTRDLANEPPNVMTPRRLAQAAKEMARKNGLSCRVLGLREIKNLKMGGVIGVSQGSAEEPQFIILENRPARPRFKDPIVLVGKGITFDTGGISIKPSNDMDKMKFDMCGAAAVIGAMKAIANLKLPVKVVGLTPVCENMPGSKAQRPGDIVTCLNGKTVEVLNTDAEGRLILADALSYAKRFQPKALVDVATLTGACAATFADLAIGLMGTDPELVGRVKEAGEQTGERCWELPLWDEYFSLIKATYADLQNISKKYAGTITAGMFLKEFADHTKAWAHLDIAGTAWNESGPKALSPIGATGVGVRLFVRLVKSYLE
jgi:leucyl aminopeptidase